MKSITPYINFDGRTREAMTFYAKCLGAELSMQSYKEAGMVRETDIPDRIIHARLSRGPLAIMASDIQPGMTLTPGNNVYVCVDCDSNEIDALYTSLGEGGTIEMALGDMFWGARFGMLTDRFGVHWMFNSEKPKS